MTFYRLAFGFDTIFVTVLLFFYVSGLTYTGSSSAQGLWLTILAVPVSIMIGAWQLKARGWTRTANGLLGVVALPPLAYILFFAVLILSEPTWR